MKKVAIGAIALAAIVGWHIYVATLMENEYWQINWLTDVATVKLPSAASAGLTDPQEVAGFNWGRSLTGAAAGEQQLSLYARRYLDLYAMLIPYRVAVVDRLAEPKKVAPSAKPLANSPNQPLLDNRIYDVAEIRSQFVDDEPRASALHKGTIMFIKGVTGKLLTNSDTGDHVVMLHDQNVHDSFVACRMSDDDLSVLAQRNDPGTVIVLSGECRGWIDGALWFKHCQLEQVVR